MSEPRRPVPGRRLCGWRFSFILLHHLDQPGAFPEFGERGPVDIALQPVDHAEQEGALPKLLEVGPVGTTLVGIDRVPQVGNLGEQVAFFTL